MYRTLRRVSTLIDQLDSNVRVQASHISMKINAAAANKEAANKDVANEIVIIWYESPGCADMVVIQSSGSMVADMITALTHTIVKHRKIEPINVDVWKMRMQLLLTPLHYQNDLFSLPAPP